MVFRNFLDNAKFQLHSRGQFFRDGCSAFPHRDTVRWVRNKSINRGVQTWSEKRIAELVGKLQESGLPNLFIPRENQFVKVDELPMLGTGKLNLRELKRIAQEKLGD